MMNFSNAGHIPSRMRLVLALVAATIGVTVFLASAGGASSSRDDILDSVSTEAQPAATDRAPESKAFNEHFGLQPGRAVQVPAPPVTSAGVADGDWTQSAVRPGDKWTITPGTGATCVKFGDASGLCAQSEESFAQHGAQVYSAAAPSKADVAAGRSSGGGAALVRGIVPDGFISVRAVSKDGTQTLSTAKVVNNVYALAVPGVELGDFRVELIRSDGSTVGV